MFNKLLLSGLCASLLLMLLAGCGKSDVGNSPPKAALSSAQTAMNVKDIAGDWMFQGGKATIEAMASGAIKVTNEVQDAREGRISGGKLEVPEWKTAAVLSGDKKSLTWDNGSVWTR